MPDPHEVSGDSAAARELGAGPPNGHQLLVSTHVAGGHAPCHPLQVPSQMPSSTVRSNARHTRETRHQDPPTGTLDARLPGTRPARESPRPLRRDPPIDEPRERSPSPRKAAGRTVAPSAGRCLLTGQRLHHVLRSWSALRHAHELIRIVRRPPQCPIGSTSSPPVVRRFCPALPQPCRKTSTRSGREPPSPPATPGPAESASHRPEAAETDYSSPPQAAEDRRLMAA